MKQLRTYGMTIVELLVVISIIVILALIAMWYFRSQIFKGNDAKRKGDLHEIQVALEEYEKDNNCYPQSQYLLCTPGTALSPYLNKVPCDPNGGSYLFEPEGKACPSWYRIYVNLDYKQDPEIPKIGCQYGCGPNLAFNYYVSSPNAPPAPNTPGVDFFGCINHICTPIKWDPSRPGPECDPNYQDSNCYNQCPQPLTECLPWKNK